MGRLFDENGYINIQYLDRPEYPFVIVVGARGVGKTYSLLKYCYEQKRKVFYLRRTDSQARVVSTKTFNPYKTLFEDLGVADYDISKTKPKAVVVGGVAVANIAGLSTFANLRGFDGGDVDDIFYDEFIPEHKDGVIIRDESEVLWNAYETVNRNRELKGRPPVKLWMFANSNSIESPIFASLGIMQKMLSLSKSVNAVEQIPGKGLLLVSINNSPISERKAETALYRLVDDSFKKMALRNDYRYNSENIRSFKLAELEPKVRIGEVVIYRHKTLGVYYGTFHVSGAPEAYGTSDSEIERFSKKWGFLYDYYRVGYVMMESLECDYVFKTLLKF